MKLQICWFCGGRGVVALADDYYSLTVMNAQGGSHIIEGTPILWECGMCEAKPRL